MVPWARDFNGVIERQMQGQSFVSKGIVEVEGPESVRITELPLYRWTEDYKSFLDSHPLVAQLFSFLFILTQLYDSSLIGSDHR